MARLLLRKKLSKFDTLVQHNITPTPSIPTVLNDDLTGFWDSMCIDVVSVRSGFDTIAKYEANHWRPLPVEQVRVCLCVCVCVCMQQHVIPAAPNKWYALCTHGEWW
jgi:hypothetical protein